MQLAPDAPCPRRGRRNRRVARERIVGRAAAALIAGLALSRPAMAAPKDQEPDAPAPEDWNLHGQFTLVDQFHPAFTSPYRGPNSLDPGNRGDETTDLTLFAGVRLWSGGEAYADGEVDQGFGLSNTLGVAGFPSAEAYKVGAAEPYVRLPRAFFRQTIDLGGAAQPVDSDQNQLAGSRAADNLVITIGKFSVTDIFDANAYAHDPKADFLNWAIVDSGAFDYAADAWGYTYGVAAEWTQDWWTLRGGFFDLSRLPNDKALDRGFDQWEAVVEAEDRITAFDRPGKVKLLAFVNYGRMGNYLDAVNAAAQTGAIPDVAAVRRFQARPGGVLNIEQAVSDDLGLFLRASLNDGTQEAFEFTEINQSLAVGGALKGAGWDRPDDSVGAALAIDGLSDEARRYFAAGGQGILIGDGRLPHYGAETIVETWYKLSINAWAAATVDYQFIANPAYNRDRGPVSVFGGRLHLGF
jgi:high affinity Mn2+ porin